MTHPTTTADVELFTCTSEDCEHVTADPFPHIISTGHQMVQKFDDEGSTLTVSVVTDEDEDEL